MQASSDLFRELRYTGELAKGGELLSRIADLELSALGHIQAAWAVVREIANAPVVASKSSAAA